MSERIVSSKVVSDGWESWIETEEREEIVRCRDCRHYMDYEYEFEPNLGYCRKHDREEVRDSWYCAWAERRDA